MKITRRQLRRIIKETIDHASGDYNAFEHAKIWSSASDALDIRLMDAGLHDLAMDMRQLIELLNKIRKTTGGATIQK